MRALLPVVMMGLLGCSNTSPVELRVHTLEVTREDDGISSLDIEIHIFDEATGEHLGCSGSDQGLEEVDASDVNYRLNAHFRSADRNERMTIDMVEGRTLIFDVWEDDARPCPTAPSDVDGDDPVGTSGPLQGDSIDIGVLTFGNVNELELGYQ